VADCPPFRAVAKSLWAYIEGCDFGGYNSNKFDIPVLVEEFLRAGLDVDLRKSRFIDVQNIFHKMEQRTLVAAYKFYCDKDLTEAHSAEADTLATYEVLLASLSQPARAPPFSEPCPRCKTSFRSTHRRRLHSPGQAWSCSARPRQED